MTIYMIITALLITGVLFLLDINPVRGLPNKQQLKHWTETLFAKFQRKTTLKAKIYTILGKKKENIFARTKIEALQTLAATGEQSKSKRMEQSCFAFAGVGFLVGLMMNNPFLAPVLGIGLYFIPLWAIKLSYNSYITHVNDELEIALSQITATYVSSSDLVQAVKENLKYISPPVFEVFEKFVYTVERLNPNISSAILEMQRSFDSVIFAEWCSALIQCQEDSSLKVTLQPHVNKFSRQKYMQEKQRTGQMLPFQEFAVMSLLVLACIPGIALFNQEWFTGLVTNPIGKGAIALTVVVMIVGLNKAIDIARPYQYRR